MNTILMEIDELKNQLDAFRPLNQAQLKNLLEAWDIEYTYESNRIEGNSLTLRETHLVVAKRMTLKGKSVDEHLEARNHQYAIDYIREIAEQKISLSEHVINTIHSLILAGINPHDAGKYRSVQVLIFGATHKPPAPYLVPSMMADVLLWHAQNQTKIHPVLLAAKMHQKIVTIHPWIDGSGRTSRLLMNFILLQNGYPIARIKGDDLAREAYYNALDASQINDEHDVFENLVAEYVRDGLREFLEVLQQS